MSHQSATVSKYFDLNRGNWDDRAPAHAASPDYGVKSFIEDPSFISDVVRYDRSLLPDITGFKCVHLQCHIGTDTLSLARLGAASVTGLDFSAASVSEARALASKASGGEKLTFVEASVYDGLGVLERGIYDFVFTGIGALCWLPDVEGWAKIIAGLLKPGGRFFIREGHPVLWSLDDSLKDRLVIKGPYFERAEPLLYEDGGTYVQTDQKFTHIQTAEWNHGIGEIITALLKAGMRITGLTEHQSLPWNAIPGQMKSLGNGEYGLVEEPWRVPLSYTLQAVKEEPTK